jgi:hypothetical protein
MCRRTLEASSAAGPPGLLPCTSPLVTDHRPAIQRALLMTSTASCTVV